MATSRTGTAKWKRLRQQALAQAQREGQTLCPLCGTRLDWNTPLAPASPEADHIVPHARGGNDDIDNLRVICRHCNQSRGGKQQRNTAKNSRRKPRIIRTNHQETW